MTDLTLIVSNLKSLNLPSYLSINRILDILQFYRIILYYSFDIPVREVQLSVRKTQNLNLNGMNSDISGIRISQCFNLLITHEVFISGVIKC